MPTVDKNLVSAAIIVLIILMALVSFNQVRQMSLRVPVNDLPTVTVQGEGKVIFIPDLAGASFSVVSEGLTPKQVQDANTNKINAVIDFLKSQGVDSQDIQTSGYFLNPKYFYPDRSGGTPFISGYTLTQTITVKIRDIDKVGEVISGVVEQGVNQTGLLNFTVDDERLEELRQEARVKAITQAKEKAENMSKAIGVRLQRIVGFSESFFGVPRPIFETAIGKGGGGAPIPSIEPGSEEIAVSVSITYQIR